MKMENIKTLGELKKSGYVSKSIKDELRHNLREKIKSGKPVFEGVHGFENTVIHHKVNRPWAGGHQQHPGCKQKLAS